MSTDPIAVGDVVRVVWADHAAGPQGWHGLHELPSVLHVVTWGVVVHADDESITIAGSLGWDLERSEIDTDAAVGDATAIVRSCIRYVRRYADGSPPPIDQAD